MHLGLDILSVAYASVGEDEEASAAEFTGGDRPICSVLHPSAGETHLPQLGQRNSHPGSHLSFLQGTDVLWDEIHFLCVFF